MAIRRGSDYLTGIQDERQVWLGTERVADVTAHPRLGDFAKALADVYDLQHDPAHQELLTIEVSDDRRAGGRRLRGSGIGRRPAQAPADDRSS